MSKLLKAPKGTLLIRPFHKNAPVTQTAHSKKSGIVFLLKASILDHESAVGYYGSYTTAMRMRQHQCVD